MSELERTTRDGVSMVAISTGHDGKLVRARAVEVLSKMGYAMHEMLPQDLQIDVARAEDGRSFWTVWVAESIWSKRTGTE